MARKTSQLQIRVTAEQKRTMKRLAREASMDMSAWVLRRVLPDEAERFQALVADVGGSSPKPMALAELADFLRALPLAAFQRAVAEAPRARIDPGTLNHIAGSIELAAARRGVEPPAWTATVTVPATPTFGSSLESVRLHLLANAPIALRRRNVFADASIDDRV